jgi:trehalose 6-phosphate phosphatase
MEWISGRAEPMYAAVVRAAEGLVVGLDFDGTLAPIVEDPEAATIHPDIPAALIELAEQVRGIAVVTGRPARAVLEMGGLEAVGAEIGAHGRDLEVLGQYGNERWSSAGGEVISPPPPAGLSELRSELPQLLAQADATDAWIEEKGLALAVHTRRMVDPQEAYERLLSPLTAAATRHGLIVEPGRCVIEMRAAGMDKGDAVHRLVEDLRAEAVIFIGDDLGDLTAFRAARELDLPSLLVCSGPPEVTQLRELADVAVPGPDGVLAFLLELTRDLADSPL